MWPAPCKPKLLQEEYYGYLGYDFKWDIEKQIYVKRWLWSKTINKNVNACRELNSI